MAATPTLTTATNPNVTLSASAVTLSDSATLSGGSNPTGTITFTLTGPGNVTEFTDVVTVNGNGTYTTLQGNNPGGFTLPTSGTVAGTYSWNATYSGDPNNNGATASPEPTVVSPASPSLSTTASPGGPAGTTLTDIAHFSGGYLPTGTITFTLTGPGNVTEFTDVVTVNGNGTYTTLQGNNPGGFTLPTGTVAGTDVWHVTYSGDPNNNPATANLENVTVGPQADLSVIITDGRTTAVPGTSDTYTIAVSNNGPSTVSSVTLTDAIPADLLNAAFAPSVGAYDVANGVWSGLSLASGGSISMTLTGTIDPNATGSLTNTVTVFAPTGVTETNPVNNVATDTDTLPPFTPNPSPPPGTTADMILRASNTSLLAGHYEIYDIGNNAILAANFLGKVGPDFQFAGLGSFFGSDTTDMLLRSASTGAFEVYDISNNNITNAAALGTVGLDFQVAGFGDFNRDGATDMILRSATTGQFELYNIRNNAITSASNLGTVGLTFQVAGFGDFNADGTTDMMLRNATTGQFELYDIVSNQITSAFNIGTVGLDFQVAGFADFNGDGTTDMMLRNKNTGQFEVYDIRNNAITSAPNLGTVGLDFQVAGFGPFHAPGASDMILRNANTGQFELYDIVNNQITSAFNIGAVGLDFQVGGFAADPPTTSMGSSDGSTSQLVQAMAGFGGGSGAGESLSAASVSADTSQQTLLTTPHV